MKITKRPPVEVTCPIFTDGMSTVINYKRLIELQASMAKFNNKVPAQKKKINGPQRRG